MADVDSGGGGGGRGRKGGGSKTKKKSTRIDMTAMVDVAFLLLTFFVLTAVIQDSAIMSLTMPPKAPDVEEEEKRVKVDEEKIVTLILEEDDKITWYQGITNPELKTADYDPDKGLRQVVLDHLRFKPRLCRDEKRKYGQETPDCWDPIFIIKPRYNSAYGNLVDVLDEMAITEAPKYAIDKFTEVDSLLLIGELEVEEVEE